MERPVELNFNEKNVLESIYGRQNFIRIGYNPHKLEKILDLTAQEKKFFTSKNFLSPHFFIQTLYKIDGTFSTIKFNSVVRRMIGKEENLRANFCNVGSRTVKVIKPLISIKPEIIFRNLMNIDKDELNDEFRKILEADMRRNFDLRYDLLMRFAVYKTDKEEFAVLVTVAQLISDSFDAEKFFCELFDITDEISHEKTSDDLNLDAKDIIREYWTKILDNPPPSAQLPFTRKLGGTYRQKAYRTKIDADIFSDLRTFSQSNKMILTAILQSAWGFMLQAINKRRDCLFCQLLPANRPDFSNFSLNVIPVRLSSENNLTVEEIIRQQFRQLVISQTYSFDWVEMENFTGDNRKLFEHFLSFAEFQEGELDYIETPADPHGKIISRNSWDAQGMKLGVYFRHSEKNLSLTFLYDESSFVFNGGELIANLYKLVLQQVLVDKNSRFSEFMTNLDRRIKNLIEAEDISNEDSQKKIRDFLSQLPILQGRYEGTIDLFADNSELVTRFEGDRLSGDFLDQKFIFVISGKLARNVDTGDGWYNPIDIVGKNSFVNPTHLLDKRRLTISAEVLTEQAELLLIPRSVLIETLRKNPEVALSVMNYALIQMEKYQILWLQS